VVLLGPLHCQTTLPQVMPSRPQQQRDPNDHHTKDQSAPLHVQHPSGTLRPINSIWIRRKTAPNDTTSAFYDSYGTTANARRSRLHTLPLLASTWFCTMSSKVTSPSDPLRPSEFVRVEATALNELALRLDGTMLAPFTQATDLLLLSGEGRGRIVVTGIGKSGIIARKIAATLRSTGTQAHFLHAAEAIHGDLGMLASGDIVLALSYSGETEELLRLLPTLERLNVTLIAISGCSTSTLAQASDIFLDTSVSAEACSLNLAPTASTTVMLALGDALALEVSRRRGWKAEDFADLHPGGRIGRRLARVRELMHSGDALPQVASSTPMTQVIYEMSRKKLGMTTVLEDGRLAGMISDGDLRRLLERDGSHALEHTAGEIMNAKPLTIDGGALASSALAVMEEKKITSLIVIAADGRVEGVVHLHDLWTLQLN
jgi:arabinose-5-phosphate isomerase